MPEFPGGVMSAFMDYIKTNMRYPASADVYKRQSVFCREGGQVEPATESGVDDDNVCRMHVNIVLQRFRRRNLNRAVSYTHLGG